MSTRHLEPTPIGPSRQQLLDENDDLRRRLAAAEDALRALRLDHARLLRERSQADMREPAAQPFDFEELRRRNRTLHALGHSNRALVHAQTEAELLEEVCRIIVHDCDYAMVWIGYAENDEARSVRPVASAGFEAGYLETLHVTWADTERGRGPTGTAIRTGRPCQCTDMLTDPKFAPWRDEAIARGYASSLVLPLLSGGQAFGAVTIYSRLPQGFSDDEVKLLSELAGDLAQGITTIRLRAAHQRAEAALAESRARLELALRSAQMATFDWDIVQNQRSWSDEVHRLLGTSPASFTGTPGEFFQIIHPDDRAGVQAALSRAVDTTAPYETEYRAVWPDGSVHHIAAQGEDSSRSQRPAGAHDRHLLGHHRPQARRAGTRNHRGVPPPGQ